MVKKTAIDRVALSLSSCFQYAIATSLKMIFQTHQSAQKLSFWKAKVGWNIRGTFTFILISIVHQRMVVTETAIDSAACGCTFSRTPGASTAL